jgi:hypothetical protein
MGIMTVNNIDPRRDFEEDEFEDRVVYLIRDEGLAILDKYARQYLDMSGEEFLHRWDTGDFEDPDSFEVFQVGMLVPLAAE